MTTTDFSMKLAVGAFKVRVLLRCFPSTVLVLGTAATSTYAADTATTVKLDLGLASGASADTIATLLNEPAAVVRRYRTWQRPQWISPPTTLRR
jgi:hypothetical protein